MLFQKKNKQALIQSFLRGSKFFEKGHIDFPPVYCQRQPSKGGLRNNCSPLVVKTLEKLVLPTFQANQWVTVLKKHQEKLN